VAGLFRHPYVATLQLPFESAAQMKKLALISALLFAASPAAAPRQIAANSAKLPELLRED